MILDNISLPCKVETRTPIKLDGWNHHFKDKKEDKKRPKDAQPTKIKERRELVAIVVRSYLNHNPFNVTYMQIMRFNSTRRFKTSISHQHNLSFYSKG
jgi:hypothetical protein